MSFAAFSRGWEKDVVFLLVLRALTVQSREMSPKMGTLQLKENFSCNESQAVKIEMTNMVQPK